MTDTQAGIPFPVADLKTSFLSFTMHYKELMAYYRCAMMEVETKFRVLNEKFSLEDDLPSEAPGKRKYEKAREELKQGILPEPSKRNENINYFYYVRYGGAGAEKSVLLKIEDIDGEQCTDMRWKSKTTKLPQMGKLI